MNRALTDFGSEESFGQAAKRFTEHYHYDLGESTVSRVTQQAAQEAQTYLEQQFAKAASLLDARSESFVSPVENVLVELDGCEIRTAQLLPIDKTPETSPIRQQPKKHKQINWREVRLGFARPLDASNKLYIGKMASYPDVVEELVGAALLNGMTAETQVIAVADGGNGLKEELERQFATLQFILDKTHVKDHLYDTAEALGLARAERAGWVTPRLDAISHGGVGQLLAELEEVYTMTQIPRVKRLIGYLQRFAEAVNYQEFKECGYPIGSGEIESAHKSVPQKRLKLPGACWHPESINPMLSLRILRANDWWEDFWEDRMERALAA